LTAIISPSRILSVSAPLLYKHLRPIGIGPMASLRFAFEP
jgi:hypothetical protein